MQFPTCPRCGAQAPQTDAGICISCAESDDPTAGIGNLMEQAEADAPESSGPRISAADQYRLNKMILDGAHPDKVRQAVLELGIHSNDVEAVYEQLGISEQRLRNNHRGVQHDTFIRKVLMMFGIYR